MARTTIDQDVENGLAVRAAWLHHTGGLTQADVAARLRVSNARAHRLISLATQRGAVRVVVEGPVVACIALEDTLRSRYGLAECHVAPDLGEAGLPLKALGAEGARFLERELADDRDRLIGFGHGRTLSAILTELPSLDLPRTRFVALMGGLTRNYIATPHNVMHGLAEKTGAEAYVMPAPFFANTSADCGVLRAQRSVQEVFDLGAAADLLVVGIGTTQPDAQLVAARMIEPAEIEEMRRSGASGELLGHFFDAGGRPVETALGARTLSPTLVSLRDRRIVAVAGGDGKIQAIRAVLSSGLLTGFVTDERTARALVEDTDG